MKLLVVFVSALVLVAHGNDTPSHEESSVDIVQSEGVADYAAVAGQEEGGPQGVFADEVPMVQAFSGEAERRIGSPQEAAAENVPIPEAGINIPIVTRSCNNAACANICHRLGFKFGYCKNANTCYCHN